MKDNDYHKSILDLKSIEINCLTKLNDSRLGVMTSCAFCGILFRRPTSHVSRVKEPCCSKACANANRKKRYIKKCVVCNTEMSLTKCNFDRIFTCSRECKSKKMKKEICKRPNNYDYKWRDERKLNLKNCCDICKSEKDLRYSNEQTLCMSCHGKRISPEALQQRLIKKGY